jgi:4-diphosphocytidyl-2-C-methyl-D-erythritol kinase
MESIALLSNAKINLFFAVNGIDSDNFCAVTTIMVPISFGDAMTFSIEKNMPTEKPIVEIFQHSSLKIPENNSTITQAIGLFCEWTGIRNFSLRVDIRKKIPIGGGFGGGSGNGVFTLRALNRLYHSPLSEEDSIAVAKKIGTDCPFFVRNLPQLAMGQGEVLSPISVKFHQNLMNYFALIFCPRFFISTGEAYEKLKQKSFGTQNFAGRIKEIFTKEHFESLLFNAFQQQILDEHAELKMLFGDLCHRGYCPSITGSGSGCFVLHRRHGALEEAQKIILKKLGPIPLCEIVRFL